MKTIELRTTDLDRTPEEKSTYADLIRVCLRVPPKEGFDLESMERRLRVLNRLDEAGKNNSKDIELEDADVETVKNCVRMMRWGSAHQDIVDFGKYICDL